MIPINYWAVLAAAIANMILGSLWYGPLFGKPWMALMGITKESMAAAKEKGMGTSYFLMMAGSLLMSFITANVLIFASAYTNLYGSPVGALVGFMSWLGFVAPVTLGSVLWEGKPWKLWFLNAGYYLVGLVLMGLILSVLR